MTNEDIEASILSYVNATLRLGDYPNRFEAIRYVTGELPVMPSQVAKAVDRMIAAGTLTQRVNGQLNLKA